MGTILSACLIVPVQVLWGGSEEQQPLGLPSSQEHTLKLLEWECGDSLRSLFVPAQSHFGEG